MAKSAWLRVALTSVVSLSLLASLAACADEEANVGAGNNPVATSDTSVQPPVEQDAEEGTPADGGDVTTGAVGTPISLGLWRATVRAPEFGSGNDDVSVPGGMQRLKIEIDLTNNSASAMSVGMGDWSLRLGSITYEVLRATRPDKHGERTVSAGETEDVTVNFAVPDASAAYILKFDPAQGGPGVLEVPLQ